MKGVGAYQSVKHAVGGADLRTVEGEALLKIAREMEEGQGDSLDSVKMRYMALVNNIRLWQVFFEDCKSPANPLPEALRTRILGLAIWIVARSEKAIAGEDVNLGPLIDINRTIARGLLAQPGAGVDDGGAGGGDMA